MLNVGTPAQCMCMFNDRPLLNRNNYTFACIRRRSRRGSMALQYARFDLGTIHLAEGQTPLPPSKTWAHIILGILYIHTAYTYSKVSHSRTTTTTHFAIVRCTRAFRLTLCYTQQTFITRAGARLNSCTHAFPTVCVCMMQCCAVTRAWSVDSCTRTQKVRNFRVVLLCCSIPSEVIQLPRKLMLCSCQRCSGPWTWRIWFMKPIL